MELNPIEREFALRLITYPYYKFKPAPYQMGAVNSKAKFLCMLGANATGKSQLLCWLTAREVLTKKPYKDKAVWWVITQTSDMAKVIWSEKLKYYIAPNNIRNISWYNKEMEIPSQVRLHNGWIIEFKSVSQGREALQGRAIAGLSFDEQWLDWSLFDECIMRTREIDNFRVLMSCTPISPDPRLQETYNNPPPDWEFHTFSMHDTRVSKGGFMPDERVDRLIATIPPEYYATRVEGKFMSLEGQIYKGFNKQIHVINNFVFPRGGEAVAAIDFGWSHPFCCLWGIKINDEWIIFDEHYRNNMLLKDHASILKSKQYKTIKYIVDPEAAQDKQELSALGINPIINARKDVMLGIEEVSRAFLTKPNGRPNLFITANCRNLIRELQTYSWDKKKDQPLKIQDDAVDPLRYLIYTERMCGGSIHANSHVTIDEPKLPHMPEAPPIDWSCTIIN